VRILSLPKTLKHTNTDKNLFTALKLQSTTLTLDHLYSSRIDTYNTTSD